MPKKKPAKHSPQKSPRSGKGGRNNNNNSGPRYSYHNGQSDFYDDTTPGSSRRGKAQRHILLGGDYNSDLYSRPRFSSGGLGFTMAQEARNTENHSYVRSDDKKLRNMRITFVPPENPDDPSAQIGTIQPDLLKKNPTTCIPPPGSLQNPAQKETARQKTYQIDTSVPIDTSTSASTSKLAEKVSNKQSSDEEEKLVFVPRNQRRNAASQSETSTATSRVTRVTESSISTSVTAPDPPTVTLRLPSPPEISISAPQQARTSKSNKKQQKQRIRGRMKDLQRTYYDEDEDDLDDEIFQDYIQNMQENGEDEDNIFSMRPLGGELDNIGLGLAAQMGLSEGDEDTPERPASDVEIELEIEIAVEIAAVIGRRSGQFGVEYRFKPAGSTVAESIWLEGNDMTQDIQHLIDLFEANLEDMDDDDSSGEIEPEESDEEVEVDESMLADEKLARKLQAQEHGYEYQGLEEEEDDDEEYDAEFLLDMMSGKPNVTGKYPNASKLADAYDDFDIMDRNRPSLAGKSNRKGRKAAMGQYMPDLGMDEVDRELEAEMLKLVALQAEDRHRKRTKKQEREIQRAAGLLGKSPDKPGSMDFRGYAGDGFGHDYKDLIKQFLMSGKAEQLSLMPMTKEHRLKVHIIAKQFGMTSKSQGKGGNRFPVLYKTKRSQLYEGDDFEIDRILETQTERIYWGKNGGRGKSVRVKHKNSNSIHNPEGTVVAAGAAEIGQGNKGYEMLAKMGWTTGTGLGSSRSGMLDPVQAIVKNSRTGLG